MPGVYSPKVTKIDTEKRSEIIQMFLPNSPKSQESGRNILYFEKSPFIINAFKSSSFYNVQHLNYIF